MQVRQPRGSIGVDMFRHVVSNIQARAACPAATASWPVATCPTASATGPPQLLLDALPPPCPAALAAAAAATGSVAATIVPWIQLSSFLVASLTLVFLKIINWPCNRFFF